ncbi:MAG TPA: respiratory nitrate reductase subunit gamma [Aurantimonas sp.]|uniref:nitrate reductase (quinone) n=1 Tax=Aurantimonas marianensis TaxID=2920428 RepID=A0A9X2H6B4_9HYPH|nr:respiratory nitrate reductase subunit gamma [Aurantimonas marianensis]MCP3054575.1 respiratory nitrate reductase subunit gamma [Aurantimonas marianensis]
MTYFIFGVLPYLALTVLVVGSIVRYERDPFTWKSSSSQLLRRKQLIWGSILFHVGILIVFFGHLIGMLTPVEFFHALHISYGFKQMMAIVVGGIAGAMAIVGGAMLLNRRLFDARVRASSSFADTGILVLLFAQLIVGMGTILVSIQHLDGGEMVKFMDWARAIFTFRKDAWRIVADVHWIYQLHILLGLTIFILFPFTRLVHMLSVPVRYLWRPGYQIVRTKKRALHQPAERTS